MREQTLASLKQIPPQLQCDLQEGMLYETDILRELCDKIITKWMAYMCKKGKEHKKRGGTQEHTNDEGKGTVQIVYETKIAKHIKDVGNWVVPNIVY